MTPRLSASAPIDRWEDASELSAGTCAPAPRVALSFEVIPPRRTADHAADAAKISTLLDTLEAYQPDYIAVTSSHRSGWLEGTAEFIHRISTTTSMRPLAHLACTAGTRAELSVWIDRLIDAGVRGFLALRGDLPAGQRELPAGYLQHADALVRLIREREQAQAARFAAGRLAVGVACYPDGHAESASPDEDLDVLLAKQRIGADFAISQLFFDAEVYHRFVQQAQLAGVRIPLIPGIMPITSQGRLERMSQLSGVAPPAALAHRLATDDRPEVGLELTADLARSSLQSGARALHIYTHNNAELTVELLERIGITP